jgi:DNA-binding MarR family transcriptional regulator
MAADSTTNRLSTPELRAWRGLLRAHAALSGRLDAELQAAHGVNLSGYEVLFNLADARDAGLRMADLADRVLLSRSGVTRLIDRLVADGLIERRPCAADGRGSCAHLTSAGRARLREARGTHLDGVRRLFLEHLSPAEQVLLGDLWERLVGPAEPERPRAA